MIKKASGLPRVQRGEYLGRLIVIEGTDGVGRSTQIAQLVPWMETNGFAVVQTGWNRSILVSKLITSAKEGTLLNKVTFTLLYATDFAERMERVVIPALKAGMIVVADRYVYAAMARSLARGVDADWIREIYSFAPKPDLTLLLRLEPAELLRRTLDRGRLSYWESGMDQHMSEDIYDSFLQYQGRMIAHYDSMAAEFNWPVLDAKRPIHETQLDLRRRVAKLLGIAPRKINQRVKPYPLVVDV